MAEDANLNKRFEMIQKRLVGQAQGQAQQNKEQLERKLAQGIGTSSGAGIKLQNQMGEQTQKQIQDIGEAVEGQKLEAQMQMDEAQKNRDFATSERMGSQEFSRGERMGSQQFAKGERVAGQKFASSEASKQRGFSQGLFDKEMAFKEAGQKIQQSQFREQLAESLRQFDKQFDLDETISKFNMDMANKMFNKPDMIEKFLGAHGLPKESPFSGMFGGSGGSEMIGGGRNSGLPKF